VENTVAHLRMPIRTLEFVPDPALFENCPGLLLIDPQVASTPDGRETLRHAAESLRSWVGIAVLSSRRDGSVDIVTKQFHGARNMITFDSHDDWRNEVRGMVGRARRRFLTDRPSFPPGGPPLRRPTLREDDSDPDAGTGEPPPPGRME
jgi:hypothetical protein